MNEYIDTLKKIFNPVAIFMKDEEFIVIVKDETDIEKRFKELYELANDDMSLVIMTQHEYESIENKELGERVL